MYQFACYLYLCYNKYGVVIGFRQNDCANDETDRQLLAPSPAVFLRSKAITPREFLRVKEIMTVPTGPAFSVSRISLSEEEAETFLAKPEKLTIAPAKTTGRNRSKRRRYKSGHIGDYIMEADIYYDYMRGSGLGSQQRQILLIGLSRIRANGRHNIGPLLRLRGILISEDGSVPSVPVEIAWGYRGSRGAGHEVHSRMTQRLQTTPA